jgi:VIT1/CCC1 family predicted Fe2+/Mn2+ transporter
LKKASNVEDLLAVKERLADVRAQIESYTAQLKSLENQTDYSTITLTVEEVEREVKKEGYWNGIWNNIIKGFENVWTIITSTFAFLISAIPYLILMLAVAAITLVLVRYFKKKKTDKKK